MARSWPVIRHFTDAITPRAFALTTFMLGRLCRTSKIAMSEGELQPGRDRVPVNTRRYTVESQTAMLG